MGFIVFLLIVVGIIVIVVVVKNKHKKARKKAIEELENSNVHAMTLKVMEELKKKGINFESRLYKTFIDIFAIGFADGYITDSKNSDLKYHIHIACSEYSRGLNNERYVFRYQKIEEFKGYRIYGIENENIGIQDAQEFLKIAAEVLKINGNGSCVLIGE